MKKKLFSLLLFLAMMIGFHQKAAADQLIRADISSDGRDQLSVTLRNQSSQDIRNVHYQLRLPAGYQPDGQLPEESLLKADQTHEFTVKVKQNKTAILPQTGEKVFLFSVLGFAVLAFGLLLWKSSLSRKFLLSLLLISGSVLGTVLVSANTLTGSMLEFSQRVRLFEQDVPVSLAVYYKAEGVAANDEQSSSASTAMPSSDQSESSAMGSAAASSEASSSESLSASSSSSVDMTSTLPDASSASSSTVGTSSSSTMTSSSAARTDSSRTSDAGSLPTPSTDSGASTIASGDDNPAADAGTTSPDMTTPSTDSGNTQSDPVTPTIPVPVPNPDTSIVDPGTGTGHPMTQPSDQGGAVSPDGDTGVDPAASSDGGSLPTPSTDSGAGTVASGGDTPTTDAGTTSPDLTTPPTDSGSTLPDPVTPTTPVPVPNPDAGAVDPDVGANDPTSNNSGADQPSGDPGQPSDNGDKPSDDKADGATPSDNVPGKESTEEILVSGYALSNLTGRGMEFGEVSLRENGKEIQTFETDSDGYFYVHLTKGKTYTLHGEDFEASITANGNNDFQVHNILGQFSLGRNNSDTAGKVILNPSVVQLDIVDYQVDEAAKQVVFPEEKKLNPGDIIVLPASGSYPTGFAFKVLTSKIVDGKTILTVTDATLEEVAKEIDVQTEFDFTEGTVTLAEGTTLVEGEDSDSLGNRASISAEAARRRTWKRKIGGAEVALNITGKIEGKINWSLGKPLHLYAKPSLNFKLNTEYKREASFDDKVKLLRVTFTSYYGTTITTDIYVFVSAEGKFNISTESNFDVVGELGFKGWDPYFTQNVQLTNELDMNMTGQMKVGPLAVIKPGFLNISALSFDVAVGLGIEGELNAKVTQKNLEAPKLESASGKANFFGDLTIGYKFGFDNVALEGKFLDGHRLFEQLIAKGEYKPNSGKRKLKDAKPMSESDYHSSGNDSSDDSDDSDNDNDEEPTTGDSGLPPSRPITNIKIGKLLYDIDQYPWIKWELAEGPYTYPDIPIETVHFHAFHNNVSNKPIYYTLYDANKDGQPEVYYLLDGKIASVVLSPANGLYLTDYEHVKVLEGGSIRTYLDYGGSYNDIKVSSYRIYTVNPENERLESAISLYMPQGSKYLYRYMDLEKRESGMTFNQAERAYLTAPEVDWESLPWQPFVRREDWLEDDTVFGFNRYGAV